MCSQPVVGKWAFKARRVAGHLPGGVWCGLLGLQGSRFWGGLAPGAGRAQLLV